MPAPHALYSKMLAERTASRNVLVLFYFILFISFYLQTHDSYTLCQWELLTHDSCPAPTCMECAAR
jgi:hypothetical protein